MPDLWEDTGSAIRGAVADVYETADDITVEMAVPGVSPEDININVTGDTLTISGESKKEEEHKDKKRNYYQKQIRYGSFAQSVALPAGVQADKADASFRNGILKITLPKAEEAKPKRIQIKVDDGKGKK
jgi:HSP20 family protein